jgi:hypothetical protein
VAEVFDALGINELDAAPGTDDVLDESVDRVEHDCAADSEADTSSPSISTDGSPHEPSSATSCRPWSPVAFSLTPWMRLATCRSFSPDEANSGIELWAVLGFGLEH